MASKLKKAEGGAFPGGGHSRSRRQRQAIELLATDETLTSLAALARQLGVRTVTVRRWCADPAFRAAIAERVREDLRVCLAAAKRVLLQKALVDGDRECLRLLLRMTGLVGDDDAPRAPATPEPSAPAGLEALSDDELLARARRLREWVE